MKYIESGKVRFVWREFPLDDPKARRGSLAHSSIAGWASVPPWRAVFNPQPIGDSAT